MTNWSLRLADAQPFHQLLVAVQSGVSPFCRTCNWNTCGKGGQTHIGGFFIFCWLRFSSHYDLSESYKPKNCLHINLPFGADKILHFREDTSFQNYFFPVWVCVLLQWEAPFPPHHWFAHSLMWWVNASRIGASEWLRELVLPNELVHLNRERSDHTPGKRKSFLNAFKNF